MSPDGTAPWRKPAPKQTTKITLTPASIRRAKAAAKQAGRRYPNLIDNMAAARAQRVAEEKRARKASGAAKRPDRP